MAILYAVAFVTGLMITAVPMNNKIDKLKKELYECKQFNICKHDLANKR